MADPFGPHAAALKFRAMRSTVLANNLANADTPGFKARDVSFDQVLGSERSQGLSRTHVSHIGAGGATGALSSESLAYRMPTQPTLDGNTVETDIEQAQFAENVVQYRASLMFINGKITGLRHALTGER